MTNIKRKALGLALANHTMVVELGRLIDIEGLSRRNWTASSTTA